jgi:hypothetical protein
MALQLKKEGRYEMQEIRDLTDFDVGRLGNRRSPVGCLMQRTKGMARRDRLQDGRLGDASLPQEPTLKVVLRQTQGSVPPKLFMRLRA